MEGEIIVLFSYAGMLSLYLVILGLTARGIYSSLKNWSKDDKIFLSILGGIFWPITIPSGILSYWIYSILNIPLGNNFGGEEYEEDNGDTPNQRKVRPKFKVGNLITGVSGNPGNYQRLYEGCVCRVLEVRNNDIKVILVDHKDKEAHKIGTVHTVPAKNFKLIKKPTKGTKK